MSNHYDTEHIINDMLVTAHQIESSEHQYPKKKLFALIAACELLKAQAMNYCNRSWKDEIDEDGNLYDPREDDET